MKNPLNRRIFRELTQDFGKYIVIMLFMVVTVGFVSGDLVAGDSMLRTLADSYEKYNVEHGHFLLEREASKELLSQIEAKGVTLYNDFYVEKNYIGFDKTSEGNTEKTLRIYYNRSKFNKPCILEGTLPEKNNDIAIDRMYAENNQLVTGDILTLEGKDYTICGLIALPDYNTLFESLTDTMFDSINFSIALVTKDCFEQFAPHTIQYNYGWTYHDGIPADTTEEKHMADTLSENIVRAIVKEEGGSEIAMALGILSANNSIEDFVPRYANQAIQFAREDIGGDRNMMLGLLYILIAIMAFIFGVTISHTITKEATVIGTLRASGYTKGELFRQYITMPVIVTLLSAVIGNVLGYTLFKNLVAAMYYNSYSLPTYVTFWNVQAFLLTTIIPVIVMIAITSITLLRKLQLPPLQFLRRELSKKTQKKAIRLPHIGFFQRFRLRIILQNISSYLTLFFGIMLATTLLLFGMMLSPLLDKVAEQAIDTMVADYQYLLKEEADTNTPNTEKFAVKTMKSYASGYNGEDVSVYGIFENSRYIKEKLPERGILISTGYADKYRIRVGDTILLKEPFENGLVELPVEGMLDAPTVVTVYMSHDYYCNLFDVEDDFYSGYFSNTKITDIPESKIYNCITAKDMTKLSDQLTVSMGQMFQLVNIFAIALFLLVIYLLTKIILERNSGSISMVKILGYESAEIGRLYLVATSWVIIISVLINDIVVTYLLKKVFVLIMKSYSGWLPIDLDYTIYGKAFVITIVAYLIVALLQMRKIKKIPMDEALKNVE